MTFEVSGTDVDVNKTEVEVFGSDVDVNKTEVEVSETDIDVNKRRVDVPGNDVSRKGVSMRSPHPGRKSPELARKAPATTSRRILPRMLVHVGDEPARKGSFVAYRIIGKSTPRSLATSMARS